MPDRPELRAQLFYLFSPYGRVIDIVAQMGPTKRGQAFIVFRDLASATSAMRSLEGELFYDKKMVRLLRMRPPVDWYPFFPIPPWISKSSTPKHQAMQR